MKKQVLTLFAALCTTTAFCQSIPNGGFENWTVSNYEEPQNYYTSNTDNRNKGDAVNNVLKVMDPYHASFAVQLNTVLFNNDTLGAFIANGDISHPAGQGTPYTQKPTGVRGYFKSSIMAGDTGLFVVEFKLAGTTIGVGMYKFTGTHNSYTPFYVPLSLPATPDSFLIAATSSNLLVNHFKGIPGSMLQIDSITFLGGVAQPATLNGDFENWVPKTGYTLNGWDLSGAAQQTTDKHSGSYALELMTGNNNNNVSAADATTGHSAPGTTLPRYPFSNIIDTLSLYYKYSPADPYDSAEVILNFYKNHLMIGGNSKLLPASATYTNVILPFNTGTAPDSVIVFLNSSKGCCNLPLSYNGADFKVDDIMFKSQQVPVTDFSVPAVTCVGMPVQLSDNSSNIPTSYTWTASGGGVLSPNANAANPTVTYTANGTYTLTLTTSNSHGAGSTATKNITINPNPTLAPSSPDGPICFNSGNMNLLFANNSPGSSVVWMPGSLTTNSVNVGPNVTTTYSVTATFTTGCTSNTGTITVTVNPLPTVTVNSATICAGSAAVLTANGAVNYSWSTGSVISTTTVSPSSSDVYSVIGTDANNCQNNALATVTVNQTPTVCIGNNNPVCANQVVNLNYCGSGVTTYQWSGPNAFSSTAASPTIAATPGAAGGYTLTVTDANNCVGSGSTNVIIDVISVSVTVNNATCGSCNDGTLTAVASGGSPAYTYSWMPSGGNAPIDNGVAVGHYTVCVMDVNGCVSCDTASVSAPMQISTVNKSEGIAIYPNPSNGVFTVETTSTAKQTVQVYDVTGKIVLTREISGTTSFDTKLNEGVYIVNITGSEGVKNKRLIISK